MISFPCRCGQRIRVPLEQAGKTTRCPRCGQGVVVPPPSSCPPPRRLVAMPVQDDAVAPDSQDTAPPMSVQTPPPPAPPVSMKSTPAAPAPPAPSVVKQPHTDASPRPARATPLDGLAAAAAPAAKSPPSAAVPHSAALTPPARQAPAPHRKAPAHSRSSSRAARHPAAGPRGLHQVVFGLAVLATIGAPWFILGKGASVSGLVRSTQSGLVMSWDLLSEAPTGIGVFLISSWIVALAGVVVGLVVRGLAREVIHACLGFTGLLFFLIVGIDGLSPRGWAGQAPSVLATLSLVLLPGLLVAAHARLRFGQSLATRVLLCGLGAMVAALVLVLLIFLLVHFFSLASAARRGFILDLAWLAVGLMVLIGGCLVLTADGGTGKIAPQRCTGGLGLTYVGLAFVGLYLVVRPNVPALLAGTRGYVLMPLYLLLMLVLFGVLLCGGALQVTRRSVEFWIRRKEFAGGPPRAV